MIIMDFAKAFDKVPHRRLLYKLDYYGIRESTHKWITSWLSDPGQVFGDTYPKITSTVNRLQYFTRKGILGQDRLSGSANVQTLTFTGIEFHAPSEFPFLKGI